MRTSTLLRTLYISVTIFTIIFNLSLPVAALKPEQKKLYNQGINYFDHAPDEGCSSVAVSQEDASISDSTSGIYKSGVSSPYTLEEFMVHVLKRTAQKANVPESDVLTEQHLLALVTFGIGEGGDTAPTSKWMFNPFNTGIDAPELVAGNHAGNGTQSFKSFDAGIEGTARTFFKPTQSRMAKVLTKKDSTAKDFFTTLTYFNRYKDNKLWAEKSVTMGQANYLKMYLQTLKETRDNYKDRASLVMGTVGGGNHEKSKVTYDLSKVNLDGVDDGTSLDASATPAASGEGGSGDCSCTPSAGPSGEGTVVLDPGHSGEDRQGKERDGGKGGTGLLIGDSINPGERKQVWDVSEKVRHTLEAKGYKVIVTKDKEDSYVNLKQRAEIANSAHASIAVSIHNTKGSFGDSSAGWVIPQKVGGYRVDGNGKKVTFNDSSLAEKSAKYSGDILAARKKAEGGVQIHDLNFDGRAGLSPGNLSVVQLLSKVPWVYNEVGQTGFNGDKYAEGIANGIMKALGTPPASGGGAAAPAAASGSSDCPDAVPGDLQSTVKAYAWPTYHPKPFVEPRPAYKAAVIKSDKEGIYNGGITYNGIDCGGFVTLTMIYSGFEPNYNSAGKGGATGSPTDPSSQWGWLEKNWKKVDPKTTNDLEPGDVAINSSHTFMYVGKIEGFDSEFASASLDGRAPMSGQSDAMSGVYNWYRKK